MIFLTTINLKLFLLFLTDNRPFIWQLVMHKFGMLLTTGHTAYHILIVLAISYTIVVTVMNAMTEQNYRCT